MSGASIIYDQPMADYLAEPAISASAIIAGTKSMLHMRHAMISKHDDSAPSTDWGTAVHNCLAYGLDKFAVYRGKIRRGNEWDEFKAAHDASMIVTASEYEELTYVRRAVEANPVVREWMTDARSEVGVYWKEGKCRFDALSAMHFIDWKTTGDISPYRFEAQAFRLGYHVKMAWYLRGARAAGHDPAPHIVAIESEPPYDVVPYVIDAEMIEYGDTVCTRVVAEYKACMASGVFPGVHSDEAVLSLPTWAIEQSMTIGEERVAV